MPLGLLLLLFSWGGRKGSYSECRVYKIILVCLYKNKLNTSLYIHKKMLSLCIVHLAVK